MGHALVYWSRLERVHHLRTGLEEAWGLERNSSCCLATGAAEAQVLTVGQQYRDFQARGTAGC
jgi:hypothetical protein